MKALKKVSIALMCFFAVTAFATQSMTVTSPNKPIVITSKKDRAFKITLKSNPTTGFSWFLKGYNHKLVKPVSQKYISPKTKMMGAGGYAVWTFKLKKKAFVVPQTTVITMVYQRPWTVEGKTVSKFRVTVKQ